MKSFRTIQRSFYNFPRGGITLVEGKELRDLLDWEAQNPGMRTLFGCCGKWYVVTEDVGGTTWIVGMN